MVGIKDFGMPSCCENCNISEFDYLSSQGGAHWCCAITENECEDYGNKRNLDCPLVEIEEHKHGKWILHEENSASSSYHCSVCNRFINVLWSEELSDFPYCHCGAEMRGAENGENI